MEGFAETKKLQEMRDYPPGRYEIIAGEYKVDRCEIPDYFTDDFWHNIRIWALYEKYGLPDGKGWGQHSGILIKVLRLFDEAKAKIERIKAEESAHKGMRK